MKGLPLPIVGKKAPRPDLNSIVKDFESRHGIKTLIIGSTAWITLDDLCSVLEEVFKAKPTKSKILKEMESKGLQVMKISKRRYIVNLDSVEAWLP